MKDISSDDLSFHGHETDMAGKSANMAKIESAQKRNLDSQLRARFAQKKQ